MDIDEHLADIGEQGVRLAEIARTSDLDRIVPTCPEWTLRGLFRHVGGIHRWAATIVGQPRTERWFPDLADVAGSWPSDETLGSWLEDGLDQLVSLLRDAPAELQCFTPLAASSSKAMWSRRQAHETTIHRVDAELAAGVERTYVSAELAADGIDELLGAFLTRRRGGLAGISGDQVFHVRAADVGRDWSIVSRETGVETLASAPTNSAATVTGRAEDIYLVLWNRAGTASLTTAGNPAFVPAWHRSIQIRFG